MMVMSEETKAVKATAFTTTFYSISTDQVDGGRTPDDGE
jgi:hypothetical protein